MIRTIIGIIDDEVVNLSPNWSRITWTYQGWPFGYIVNFNATPTVHLWVCTEVESTLQILHERNKKENIDLRSLIDFSMDDQ